MKINKDSDIVLKLMSQYKGLSKTHQHIMQLKAAVCSLETKSAFSNVIQASPIRSSDGRKLHHSQLNYYFHHLVKKKLLDRQYNCHPQLLFPLTQHALSPHNPNAKLNQQLIESMAAQCPTPNFNTDSIFCSEMRAVHIAMHTNDERLFTLDDANQIVSLNILLVLAELIYPITIDADWLATRAPAIQQAICFSKLLTFLHPTVSIPADFNQWLDYYKNSAFNNITGVMQYFKWQIDINLGRLELVKKEITDTKQTTLYSVVTQGTLCFLSNQHNEALAYYDTGLKLFRKAMNKRTWFFDDIHGIFYLLLMITKQQEYTKAKRSLAAIEKHGFRSDPIFSLVEAILTLQQGQRHKVFPYLKRILRDIEMNQPRSPLSIALLQAVAYWANSSEYKIDTQEYIALCKFYQDTHLLLSYLFATLSQAHQQDDHIDQLIQASPFKACHFLELIPIKPEWEYQLNRLTSLISTTQNSTSASIETSKRLIWLIDPETFKIEVAVQKKTKSGAWGVGRHIALKRLFNSDSKLDYLTPQDWEAIDGLEQSYYGWCGDTEYEWSPGIVVPKLIGHPLIFHQQNPSIPIELVKGTIELHIEEMNDGYRLMLSPSSTEPGIVLQQETQQRYQVIQFSKQDIEICQIIPDQGLVVPQHAKEDIIGIIKNPNTNIRISADIAEAGIETIVGDPHCYAQLLPVEHGLKLNIWVRPFGEKGPYYKPEHGRAHVLALIKNEAGQESRQKASRNFLDEKQQYQSLLASCPSLLHNDDNEYEWYCDNPLDALEMLSELEHYRETHPLHIEWPQGVAFRLKKTLTHQDVSVNITSNQQWFEYDGEVAIDQDKTLQIKSLMALLNNSHGRFIKVGEGEFLALTKSLKKQLEELKAASEGDRIFHLGSSALQALAEQTEQSTCDDAWESHLKKLKSIKKYQPEIPSTLQAQLRDYQIDGFHYLARLANWNIGACLADDMGLGKTIQTIAALLIQGTKGPALVVAPTSVCFNWMDEIRKFAPALTPHSLNAGDREKTINAMGKMDVLICSYGLLVQSAEPLLKKSWQSIVLDEAQSIKNPSTKRWKTATSLQGACRFALTGTPIENHLGELWSIFRFLNPGLLSSQQKFQQHYASPIEKYNDAIAKRTLKNLVSPYILRRLKSDVLNELPPKTEQTIMIEPTADEISFYEAIRQQALENINAISGSHAGKKRFSILAEIGRLRQACCHPKLIQSDINIDNSKVKTFLNLTEGLLENNHKALVFSQFVRYLNIIRDHLDRHKIKYQYLDGQTPAKQRKKAVEAFQAGEGDLFLLSLKAGGTGLNLTAADYVIHLDPWWNPAVEDQASDRAHRIGQQRPVTIYRLVMQNTIEEKILKMHAAKRTLATDLLSGGDMSGKLTETDLINLMR